MRLLIFDLKISANFVCKNRNQVMDILKNHWINLRVADLQLVIESENHPISLASLPCHHKFLISHNFQSGQSEGIDNRLILKLIDRSGYNIPDEKELLCSNGIWQLWMDKVGNLCFTQPKQIPQRWVLIDPEFQTGEILIDFSLVGQQGFYPLEFIDIVVFSNWLTRFGDLILHASGIRVNGSGYCFLGDSGAGKSTLIEDIANEPGVDVLGEDQVILRYQNNRFMIHGTPWHERVDCCSNIGVPVKKIFILDRSAQQVLKALSGFEGVVHILRTAFIPLYLHGAIRKVLNRLSLVAEEIPFFSLAYTRGSDILSVIKDA